MEQTSETIEADLTQRLHHLTGLADEISVFAEQRHALAQAQAVVRNADQVVGNLGSRDAQGNDDGADLAERTASVLAAYRELTSQLSR